MADEQTLLVDGPEDAVTTLILAHGAGAPMDTDFMNVIADGVSKFGHRVVRFEFPYMVKRRASGGRRPPDREPILRATWHDVIKLIDAERLIIGGKSMGGRIASMIADEAGVDGLVCLGYPFHPTGKPDKLRVAHLQSIRTSTLILQGERDPFGNQTEVMGYDLSNRVQVSWLKDGDHSFKPRKSSGTTLEANLDSAVKTLAGFIDSLSVRA